MSFLFWVMHYNPFPNQLDKSLSGSLGMVAPFNAPKLPDLGGTEPRGPLGEGALGETAPECSGRAYVDDSHSISSCSSIKLPTKSSINSYMTVSQNSGTAV